MSQNEPSKLLHAVASPLDMAARCGFVFTLDKPAFRLNAHPDEVCHACAVLAYASAENKYLEVCSDLSDALLVLEMLRLERLEFMPFIGNSQTVNFKLPQNRCEDCVTVILFTGSYTLLLDQIGRDKAREAVERAKK